MEFNWHCLTQYILYINNMSFRRYLLWLMCEFNFLSNFLTVCLIPSVDLRVENMIIL